jgi:SOS-response transcriptional repressor LexA
VNPNIPAENGSLVVAKLDGTDEVTFKKLVIDAGQKYLKPLNQSYNPLVINGNCRIIGVVTESKYKF